MALWIKICGITNLPDALAAVDAGANALGFVFYDRSPRFVSNQTAATIIRAVPAAADRVGVFVNAADEQVREAIECCGLTTLQFHGEEPPEFCRGFGLTAIKAFRIRDEGSLRELSAYGSEAWLLDSFVPGERGGTGQTVNWELASQAAKLNDRIILAGGLTPANVGAAVRQVRPYGVDVSSGVEAEPGRKDHGKLQEFVRAARAAV